MVFCHVPFLFFIVICSVTVARLHCYRNPFELFWQSVRNILAIRSQHFGNPFAMFWQTVSSRRGPIYRARIYVFATHWQSLRDTFTECSQRVSYLYVTYSPCKSMVFALQKYGFWRAKRWFLHCKNPLFEMQYTKQRTRNNEVWYYI